MSLEPIEERYRSAARAESYWRGHHLSRRGSRRNRREQALCREALKGLEGVQTVLDCPAGVGRFWSTLSGFGVRLHAADASLDMLRTARAMVPDVHLASLFVARAERIPLREGAVDLVFCHRLLHHIQERTERIQILRELARVSRLWVAVSFWSRGNLRSLMRRREARLHPGAVFDRIYLPERDIREELALAGLRVTRIHHKRRWLSPLILVVAEKDRGTMAALRSPS